LCCAEGTSARCVDVNGDTLHCGACGLACENGQGRNFVTTCTSGACGYACKTGFDACDGAITDADGCETDLLNQAASCGSCGNDCNAKPHVRTDIPSTCSNGACQFQCADPWGDCGPGEGCETNLDDDEQNCGGCGINCGFDQLCKNGTCCTQCDNGSECCNPSLPVCRVGGGCSAN
jgi:hypothetical protein